MKNLNILTRFLLLSTFYLLLFSCSAPVQIYDDYSYIKNCPPDSDGVYRPYIITLFFDAPYNGVFDIKCESFHVFNANDSITSKNYNAHIIIKDFKVLQEEYMSHKFPLPYEYFLKNEVNVIIPLNYIASFTFFGRNKYHY